MEKNVFLITREEPRRYTGGKLSTFSAISSMMPTEEVAYIYITNNEEIKDCWVFNTHLNEMYFRNR